MQDNWVSREVKKADKNKDFIILENPDKKDYIDNLLINRFWPVIRNGLKNTGYDYIPKKNPEIDFELKSELTRSITLSGNSLKK